LVQNPDVYIKMCLHVHVSDPEIPVDTSVREKMRGVRDNLQKAATEDGGREA
jgi:hypothetical protein